MRVVNAQATMTDRLTLGYREASVTADSLLIRSGEKYFGHEFHRTQCVLDASALERSAWSWLNQELVHQTVMQMLASTPRTCICIGPDRPNWHGVS